MTFGSPQHSVYTGTPGYISQAFRKVRKLESKADLVIRSRFFPKSQIKLKINTENKKYEVGDKFTRVLSPRSFEHAMVRVE